MTGVKSRTSRVNSLVVDCASGLSLFVGCMIEPKDTEKSFAVRPTSLFRSFFVVSGWTAVSRLSGLIREILMANLLGAGIFTDIYAFALKLPSFFRRFFAEGAFSAVLIPHFSHIISTESPERVRNFAREMLSVLAVGLFVFVLLFEWGMPLVVRVIAPGFVAKSGVFQQVIHFARIMFPYIWLISMVAYMSGILNALHRFAWAAAISVVVNLCMITSLLVSYGLGDRISNDGILHSVMICSLFGGGLQCVFLWQKCREQGFTLAFQRPRLTPEIRKILTATLPGIIGASVTQINIFVDMAFASGLPSGSVSYLNYADRLNQFPISLLGAALGTALLPTLSRLWKHQRSQEALHTQNRAMMMGMLLALPAALGLFLLAVPLVSLIYERGRFDTTAVLQTAAALKAFVCGLPFYILVKVFSAAFFAHKDTTTPLYIALVAVGTNASLNYVLSGPYAHVGIAMATAISAVVNASVALGILLKRHWFVITLSQLAGICKILIACTLMGGVVFLLCQKWGANTSLKTLTIVMSGVLTYLAAGCLFRLYRYLK